jgi:putative FmdB family regulatory protein
MPVYVYRRSDGSSFETKQRMAEDALVACPTTGQRVERVLQPFTSRYTGTGFYSTDYRTPNALGGGVQARPVSAVDQQRVAEDAKPLPLVVDERR